MEQKHIIIFEDNPFDLEKIIKAIHKLKDFEIKVTTFRKSSELYKNVKSLDPAHLFIVDMYENGKKVGTEVLKFLKRQSFSKTPMLFHTSSDEPETIIEGMSLGAQDFISKSSDETELQTRIRMQLQTFENEKNDVYQAYRGPDSVGLTLEKIKEKIPSVLDSAVRNILVYGETGTGKDVVSQILRGFLPADTPFLSVNCQNFSGDMLTSELFGHAKGAFTGAFGEKKGIFEAASGGWVFLDEISNLSLIGQNAILRIIENGELKRLGESKIRKVDVKIIAATNVDLYEAVEKGEFKKDLLNRLTDFSFELPPLRQRKEEIGPIAQKIAASLEGGPYELSRELIPLLEQGSFKDGNIRELRNVIRRMTVGSKSKLLTPATLPPELLSEFIGSNPKSLGGADKTNDEGDDSTNTTYEDNYIKIPYDGEKTFAQAKQELFLAMVKVLKQSMPDASDNRLASKMEIHRATFINMLNKEEK